MNSSYYSGPPTDLANTASLRTTTRCVTAYNASCSQRRVPRRQTTQVEPVWSARCSAKADYGPHGSGGGPRPTGVHPKNTAMHARSQQKPPTGVVTQGCVSQTGTWLETNDHFQESHGPLQSSIPKISTHAHPDAAYLDVEPHHYPPRQNGPTLCTHCTMQNHNSIYGRGPLGLDTQKGKR